MMHFVGSPQLKRRRVVMRHLRMAGPHSRIRERQRNRAGQGLDTVRPQFPEFLTLEARNIASGKWGAA